MSLNNLIAAWVLIAALLFTAAILDYPACVGVAVFLELLVSLAIAIVFFEKRYRKERIDYEGEL